MRPDKIRRTLKALTRAFARPSLYDVAFAVLRMR